MGEQAARWFRVSSDGQDEANQVAEVDQHCGTHGYDVRRTFTLHDVSASKGEQAAALAEVIADMQAGAYSVLVTAHSSRLDRREDLDAQTEFVLAVRAAGGRVESVREPEFGKSDLTGRLVTLVAQYGNAEYSRALKANTAAGKARIAVNGGLDGRPPWGFTSSGPKYARRLVPTAEAREYVPEIFGRVIAGQSLATVARWLDAEGVRPMGIKSDRNGKGKAGQWWPRSVGALVRNSAYMGMRTDANGQTVTTVEALVDAHTWAEAGKSLDARPKRGKILKENRCYLSGAARCYSCGGPMYRTGGKYLRCSGTGADRKNCGAAMIRLDVAEKLADKVLGNLTARMYETTVIPGNEAEIQARLAALEFERMQVARRGLSWDDEDSERARIRREWEAVQATVRVPDTRVATYTGESYGALWNRLSVDERALWLREQWTVYFIKDAVPVARLAGGRTESGADAERDGVSLVLAWTDEEAERAA